MIWGQPEIFFSAHSMEIERKILEIEKLDFLARAGKLKPKPKKLFDGLVKIWYFDFPDGRIRNKRDLLRLRGFYPKALRRSSLSKARVGQNDWIKGSPSFGTPFCELVYKTYAGVKNGCKFFEELEFVISGTQDAKKIAQLFKSLGLVQQVYYEKKRTLLAYGKVKLEFDEHPRIPGFLEVEAPSPQIIDATIKKLGLQNHEQSAESIGELLMRKYPKIKLNNLKF